MSRTHEQLRELATLLALRRLGYSNAEINNSDVNASHLDSTSELDETELDNDAVECEHIISRLTKRNIPTTKSTYSFNHIAAIINWQNKDPTIICIGQNHSYYDGSSQHAEVDAMYHLPPRKNWKHRLQVVSILVVRVSRTGTIGNSAPCIHCLRSMTHLPPRMGYYIDKIHYSNQAGKIVSYKLDDLIEIDKQHITSFHRNKKDSANKINRIMEWRERYLEKRNNKQIGIDR